MGGQNPAGGWWQDERGKWRHGGQPVTFPPPTISGNRSLDWVFVGLIGALVGLLASIPFTVWMLSGAGADAFTWMVAFPFFAFVGVLLGAGVAFPVRSLWRRLASHFADPS